MKSFESMQIQFGEGNTMTNEEKEAYEWFLDRISAPMYPIPLSQEECDKYNEEHPLPTEEELEAILKEAGII